MTPRSCNARVTLRTGGIRCWIGLLLAIVPFVVGCPSEVPYVEPAESDTVDPDLPAADPVAQSDDAPVTAEEPPVEEPDRYGPPPEVPEGLPWETDKEDPKADAEASRLFGDPDAAVASTALPEADEPTPSEEEEDEGADDFREFLAQAYGKTGEEASADVSEAPKSPEPLPGPPSEPPPAMAAADLSADPDEPIAAQEDLPAEPTFESTPVAKAPTTTEPAESDLLAELWGDEPVPDESQASAEKENPPPPEPEPTTTAEFDFDQPDEPTASESVPAPEVSEAFAFDEPTTPEPIRDEDDWVKPRDEPPTLPAPEEPEEPRVASLDRPVSRPTPMASSAIEPLPAVPVLSYNTRHLAWLLGGKLGLAELADLDGATPSEVDAWSGEVDRLANELKIPSPASKANAGDPAERVTRMMSTAAAAGDALAKEHGVDHAALLEISLKTNALLVVAADNPELAAPVATAIKAAAERAVLPRFLWEETVQILEREPSAEQTLSAVTDLHKRVESFLR